MRDFQWRPYVSVARRRAEAARAMERRAREGLAVDGVTVTGKVVATGFWAMRWCEAVEAEPAYARHLARGKSELRSGAVLHLELRRGEARAVVIGAELYDVTVRVAPIADARWAALRDRCAGRVPAVLDLLTGRVPDAVAEALTAPGAGVLPTAGELTVVCGCTSSTELCRHGAAVLYAIGARLDRNPGMVFTLRGVDHTRLVEPGPNEAGSGARESRADADATGPRGAKLVRYVKRAAPPAVAAPRGATIPPPAVKSRPPKAPRSAKERPTPTAAPAGEFTAGEIRAMGHGPAAFKRMVSDGTLEKVSFGWYRFTRAPG